jgi:peptidoglycan/xylan/chitin deacetylase (PgdA/CDA1 family)
VADLDRSLGNRTRRAAFLTYHAIADSGPAFLHVPPDTFERQLALLRRKGWAPGTTAGLDALAAGQRPAAPLAFLTFDDGYVDNAVTALPLLREYGFRAIVFVIPPMVDAGAPLIWPEVEDDQRAHPGVMRSMTWEQVGEMVEAGTEIGAHTMTHPKLTTLHGEQLRQELVDSRKAVIDRLGRCDLFAYPFGDLGPEAMRAVADAGYRYAFAQPTAGQASHTRLTIPRIPVDARDDERRFGLKLHAPVRAGLLSPLKPAASSAVRKVLPKTASSVARRSQGGHLPAEEPR